VILALAGGEFEFDAHSWHGSVLAPTSTENLPCTHEVHSASPELTLYLPATHFVHGPPSDPVEPALQVQFAMLLLASGAWEFCPHCVHTLKLLAPTTVEKVPDGQLRHCDSPPTFLYFPATQLRQGPPSDPVDPTLQVQSVSKPLASMALEKSGH